ncbi:unnamed protein product [Paramecium sonneborni]|uniref:Uncharacterized protein n=1 Tax=Paramecium sonneborni TaxID=65129 RepID=A0A8S1KXG5_9CILI|nr:unnamed protein product [Paramecium sonneborni]
MFEQDYKSEDIQYIEKPLLNQSNERKEILDITEQFQKTNIKDDPSEIQSPLWVSEFYKKSLNELNNSPNPQNIIQIDKRFLLPHEAKFITFLSENTKLVKEKYAEYLVDGLQSFQQYVQTQSQNRKKKQSNFINDDDESVNLKFQTPQINELYSQTQKNSKQLKFQEIINQQQSISSYKANIQKIKEDPLFQQKFTVTQKILETLSKFEIQSSTKKVSILEDALILCQLFQKLANEDKKLIEQYIFIQENYNYKRSFQAFSTRIKIVRNLYREWTLENLEQLLRVLKEFPKKILLEKTLIQQNSIKIPLIK